MAVRKPTSEKKASLNKNLLGSSEVLWAELFEEMENLKVLYAQARATKGAEREDLEVALYTALSHIKIHAQVMLETADDTDS